MFAVLLFNIPSPWYWTTDQIANIISVVAAVATVAALWYAFYRDRKQDRKINDLSEITKKLAEQNRIMSEQTILTKNQMKAQGRPRFVLDNEHLENFKDYVLTLKNLGQVAYIDTFDFDGESKGYLEPSDEVTKNDSFTFRLYNPEGWQLTSRFYLSITLHDAYFNYYRLNVTYENEKFLMTMTDLEEELGQERYHETVSKIKYYNERLDRLR